MNKIDDTWQSGDPYDYFMGRWSALAAPEFLNWLNIRSNSIWLDVGCGTGALSEAICRHCQPFAVTGIDPSEAFLQKARERIAVGAGFVVGDAADLPFGEGAFDVIVSALALNFFPDLKGVLTEMKRVLRPGGTIAAYVWDYAGRMEFLRYFWDSACELDKRAHNFDEGIRFAICNRDNLIDAFHKAALLDIEATYLDIDTIFDDFEDYWEPFLGGQGPAPAYLASLPENERENLKRLLHEKLPIGTDGSIRLTGRVIAIRGNF